MYNVFQYCILYASMLCRNVAKEHFKINLKLQGMCCIEIGLINLISVLFYRRPHDAQCTKRALTYFAGCRPRSACTFVQADLGLLCLLSKSVAIIVYVNKQRMPYQTAQMPSLTWTIRTIFVHCASHGRNVFAMAQRVFCHLQ